MAYQYKDVEWRGHRLTPSRFPTISLFDWADSQQELAETAALEGMTNDRQQAEYGNIWLVPREDWVSGPGSTPLMAAFTHTGYSRFSDVNFGAYYAGDSLATAIAETKFHRERFLRASHEDACLIQMREYLTEVLQPMVSLYDEAHAELLHPDPSTYQRGQDFARQCREDRQWGIVYPSVRRPEGHCVAVLRAPALSIPVQGAHLDYIWDGERISEVRQSVSLDS